GGAIAKIGERGGQREGKPKNPGKGCTRPRGRRRPRRSILHGMKLAVIADTHGNLPALEAVLADIERRGITRIVDLGDCVAGPLWPRETSEGLTARGFPTVRGNHGRWGAPVPPAGMGLAHRYTYIRL